MGKVTAAAGIIASVIAGAVTWFVLDVILGLAVWVSFVAGGGVLFARGPCRRRCGSGPCRQRHASVPFRRGRSLRVDRWQRMARTNDRAVLRRVKRRNPAST